jgi:4-aminobutyrate aminotransferase-like enzyme/Ser/Thr protein kinase RdoA (MazF antagonist)
LASAASSDATDPAHPPVTSRLPEDVVAAVLRGAYGIEPVTQEPLGGEIDQNARVRDIDGTNFFVRATSEPGDSSDIQWQNSLLLHLQETVPHLPVPRLVPTLDGAYSAPVSHDGDEFVVRVMSWLKGRTMAQVEDHPRPLLRELGAAAGRLCLGLSGMEPPESDSTHDWDMRRAREVVEASLDAVDKSGHVRHVETIMDWYDDVVEELDSLPRGVVHQDLNDANVLVDLAADGELHISGIVDVGDALFSLRVTELAVAAAYAMVRKPDPLQAAADVVAGFHAVLPLTEEELSVVYPLAAARLCMNAVTWNRRVTRSGSAYGQSRMRHTWPALELLSGIHPRVAEATFRIACGLPPTSADHHLAHAVAVATTVSAHPLALVGTRELDLRPSSDLFDDLDWTRPDELAHALDQARGGDSGVPLYLPHLRATLLAAARRQPGHNGPATVQLGAAMLLPERSPVACPVPAEVELTASTNRPMVLRHEVSGTVFRTCWWGIDSDLDVGARLQAGDAIGRVSQGAAAHDAPFETLDDDRPAALGSSRNLNGALGPGVQVVIVKDAALAALPPPRFIRAEDRPVWHRLSTDPAELLGLPVASKEPPTVDEVVAVRQRLIARSQRNYYQQPMSLARGRDVWFYDEDARAYLDSLNNVTHVGHAEPRVTLAAARQMRKLNTNSRFVYPQIASYAEKLVATLPEPLEVVFLVCSGSEANDLALRIARQVTGRRHIVNIDGAYHGNTGVVTGISPNRYKGPGGQGAPPTTHEVTMPDRYRGRYGYDDPHAGTHYADLARSVIERISGDGRGPAAFIAESLMGSGGNIVFPEGYLRGVFDAARRAGALCISDEVQVGVGRLGPWWGFELQDVVPDIVTMGKPLGNGHPLAAVVTTRAIADAFDTGMKYFNTFGGNPVSCAIGEAVLDIVESDGLRANAVDVGGYFARSLRELQDRHQLIGDVRAEGLYLGVELVRDRHTKEPATGEAFAVTELTKERGVVVFPNGVHDNVLKIKPPMTFTREHVDIYVQTLDEVLALPELQVPVVNNVRKYA